MFACDEQSSQEPYPEQQTQQETSVVRVPVNVWAFMYDVLLRWILTWWVTPTKRCVRDLQQRVVHTTQCLLAGQGELLTPLPAHRSVSLRRRGSRAGNYIAEREGRTFTDVVQGLKRSRMLLL